jgi:hypothetical protein
MEEKEEEEDRLTGAIKTRMLFTYRVNSADHIHVE